MVHRNWRWKRPMRSSYPLPCQSRFKPRILTAKLSFCFQPCLWGSRLYLLLESAGGETAKWSPSWSITGVPRALLFCAEDSALRIDQSSPNGCGPDQQWFLQKISQVTGWGCKSELIKGPQAPILFGQNWPMRMSCRTQTVWIMRKPAKTSALIFFPLLFPN